MTLSHSSHQRALPKHQLCLLIREVVSEILLDLGVFVIVDSYAFVTCQLSHILYDTGFSC